jgi:DNA-directed RNA polymerase subunit L
MEARQQRNRGVAARLKINVLKKTDKELKIEIEGAGHGVCNLLQKKLLEEKSVDMAGYNVPHPLASNPVIYVRTKGAAKPEDALRKAAEKALEANAAFAKELEKALKA